MIMAYYGGDWLAGLDLGVTESPEIVFLGYECLRHPGYMV